MVRSIGAGRVLLDFNPALAGKNLIYDVVVLRSLKLIREKIGALIHRRVPAVEENQFKLILQDQNLTIEMPEVAFYVEGIQIAKRGVALDIQKFLPDLVETRFVETFKAEPKPVPATPVPPAPALPPAVVQEPVPVVEAEAKPEAVQSAEPKANP